MTSLVKLLPLTFCAFLPLLTHAAECKNTDASEQINCEALNTILQKITPAHEEAVKATGDNASLKSLDALYDSQIKNCKDSQCRLDVSAHYHSLISAIPNAKVGGEGGGGKLLVDNACDSTSKMKYSTALAAYSSGKSAKDAEVRAQAFGREVMVSDVSRYIEYYASPQANSFKQAYGEGRETLQDLFVAEYMQCLSDPYSSLPSLPDMVRNNRIDFSDIIHSQ